MDKFRNLLDILKSQCELYSELASVMALEKEAVSKWNVDDTLELTKRKDTILYKEKLLEEARKILIKKICADENRDEINVSSIIDILEDQEIKKEFILARTELKKVINRLNDENLALKILYKTNISMVNDFFERLGVTSGDTYGTQGKPRGLNTLVDRIG